jgi:hypothetical protein
MPLQTNPFEMMKINPLMPFQKAGFSLAAFLFCCVIAAQVQDPQQEANLVSKRKSDFWNHVSFGGGVAANFSNDYSNFSVSPGAIYNFNDYVGLGVGLQGSYIDVDGDYYDEQPNHYKSWLYGGSIIGVVNPIEEIQLSLEVEQVRVNTTYNYEGEPDIKKNFWNTALFIGAGYRNDNFTVGFRYNLLYDRNDPVYYEPFMPFVRVYFN